MKSLLGLFIFLLVISCNQSGKDNKTEEKVKVDTSQVNVQNQADSLKAKEEKDAKEADLEKRLFGLSLEILKCIKERNYDCLVDNVHPELGIRFSMYGHIDTADDELLSTEELVAAAKSQKKIRWGLEDGSGKPVDLSLDNYMKRFVYDADYMNAEKRAVNKFLGGGNSLNNLKEIYPGSNFTEFYFPGFDPKYNGMDWKTLRLVFKEDDGKDYLIAIVHDQWTI